MHVSFRTAACVALVVLAAGCGAPAAPPSVAAPAAPATPSVPAATPIPDAGPSAVDPGSAPAATSWVMPDLVGTGLQDAQDAIQELTDFGIPITTSTDGTGEGRNQINDRNWTVCSQNVAPGETITSGTLIDFTVVQLDENC